MATKSGISFVVLYVSDINASKEFYEKLGFEVKQSEEGYVEFATSGVPLALMSMDAATDLTGQRPKSGDAPRFSLSLGEVPDIDKTYQELKSTGVRFLKEPVTQDWGQRTAHFMDPDGNLWEVFTWVKKD